MTNYNKAVGRSKRKETMDNMQFRAFLDLMMVSDPWPLDQQANDLLTKLADEESQHRGFDNWIVAYHEHDGSSPDDVKKRETQ